MKNRFLITTAIESTWPKDSQPVLFLGEWCKLYSQKHLWQNMDSEVVSYRWDNRSKLYQDHLDLLILYESILDDVSVRLNSLHAVNHSLRYWRILIGPWLFGFISAVFDRWHSIETAISSYNISKTVILDYTNQEFIPQSMVHYSILSKSDQWNHFICSLILKKIKFNKIADIENLKASGNLIPEPPITLPSLSKRVLKVVSRLSSFFSRKNNYFIIASYLKRFDLFKLQLKLFQFPAIYHAPEYCDQINPIMEAREWNLAKSKTSTDFEKFLREVIPLQIPTVYLEGYQKLKEHSNNMSWPKDPKLIWTSNAFYEEEIFKVWAAHRVEKGTPLLIGQHGGHYGIGLFDFVENHELKICDYYLSWGSNKTNKKIIPIGIFKKYKTRVKKKKDSALLIVASTSRYAGSLASIPISSQMLDVLEDQFTFIYRLPDYIRDDLIIRTYPHDYGWSQYDRFNDKFPKIKIDTCNEKIENLWLNSKLSISGWNSTTMLESMSMDIPTIIFWNPKFFELQKSSTKYFDLLKEVGIFHESPESAAEHITKIWGDIDGWWTKPEVVSAKNIFMDRYANNSNLVNKLAGAIASIPNGNTSNKSLR